MRLRTQALVVALISTLAASAGATPSAKLTYLRGPGAESCPDESELRKAVASRLGYDPFFPSASKTVVAEIRARVGTPHGFRGVVQIIDEAGIVRGERTLATSGSDCAEMVRALALGISIAVDDLDALSPPAPPPSTTIEPAPTEPPLATTPPAETPVLVAPKPHERRADPDAARSSRPRLELLAGAHGSLGLAPAPSGGLTVGAGLASRSASLRLEGTYELPSSDRLVSGGNVRSSFVVVSVVPCLRLGLPFACATASLGSMTAGVDGIAAPHSGSAIFALVGARGGVIVPLYARFSLAPHADVAVPLVRHAVTVDGRTVFTTPSIGGALGIDLVAVFL